MKQSATWRETSGEAYWDYSILGEKILSVNLESNILRGFWSPRGLTRSHGRPDYHCYMVIYGVVLRYSICMKSSFGKTFLLKARKERDKEETDGGEQRSSQVKIPKGLCFLRKQCWKEKLLSRCRSWAWPRTGAYLFINNLLILVLIHLELFNYWKFKAFFLGLWRCLGGWILFMEEEVLAWWVWFLKRFIVLVGMF